MPQTYLLPNLVGVAILLSRFRAVALVVMGSAASRITSVVVKRSFWGPWTLRHMLSQARTSFRSQMRDLPTRRHRGNPELVLSISLMETELIVPPRGGTYPPCRRRSATSDVVISSRKSRLIWPVIRICSMTALYTAHCHDGVSNQSD